jgi:hypothetical protein
MLAAADQLKGASVFLNNPLALFSQATDLVINS